MADLFLQGFKPGAPTRQAADIDAAVTEKSACPHCGGQMHYEPWTHGRTKRYVAVMACYPCKYEVEF